MYLDTLQHWEYLTGVVDQSVLFKGILGFLISFLCLYAKPYLDVKFHHFSTTENTLCVLMISEVLGP